MGSNTSSFRTEFGLIVVGAIVFTASFLWRDLFMDIQNKLFPREYGLTGRVIFTIVVSLLLVMMAIHLRGIFGLSSSVNSNNDDTDDYIKKNQDDPGDSSNDHNYDHTNGHSNDHINNTNHADPINTLNLTNGHHQNGSILDLGSYGFPV